MKCSSGELVKRHAFIAIVGPSASGKGTVAKEVAAALGFHYLESGALYRLVALASLQQRLSNEQTASETATQTAFHDAANEATGVGPGGQGRPGADASGAAAAALQDPFRPDDPELGPPTQLALFTLTVPGEPGE